MSQFYHIDLFSGIGGFALAANWAGYHTVGFCEIDPFCRRVLGKHWPETPIHDDVRTLSIGTIDKWTGGRRVTLLTAGVPCQPVSLAGKRMGKKDDRWLWPEFIRVVDEARPCFVCAENPPGIINLGLDDVLSDLEALGYACRPVVIPACAVNAPHRRDRVWILADAERGGGRELLRTNTASEPLLTTFWREGASGARSGGTDVADAESIGERTTDHKTGTESWQWARTAAASGSRTDGRSETQRGLGGENDGLPGRLADPRWRGDPMNAFGPDWEHGVPRVVATEQDRVNKLKALGNAIVPQVAYQILLAMDAANDA